MISNIGLYNLGTLEAFSYWEVIKIAKGELIEKNDI